MKLRTRDIIAALLSILLVRIAWTDYGAGSENLGVDITLAFYADLQSTVRLFHGGDGGGGGGGGGGESLKTAKPVPLDVDGDGIVEAVVLPTVLSGGGAGSGGGNDGRRGGMTKRDGGGAFSSESLSVRWGLKVLDLKPVHTGPSGIADLSAYPFLPRTMFVSNTTKELTSDPPFPGGSTVVPVKMTSGQLILNDPHSSHFGTKKKKKKREVETDKSDPSYDRTRHYYCGKDWHDAAQNCRKHCPGGSASECGDGENCYADTPCDAVAVPTPSPNMEFNETTLSLTPGGGLPCVVTVWTDGSVTLHGLTGDVPPPSAVVESDKKKKKKKRKKKGGEDVKLELRRMWKVNPFPPAPSSSGSDGSTETNEGEKKEGEDDGKDATTASTYLHFHEIDVTLLDSDVPIGDRGVVVIAARYHRKREDDHPDHYHEELFSSYHAIDAVTGSILWTHDGYLESKKREEAMNVPGPVHVDYVMATGRRRSMIPDLTHNVNVDVAVDGSLEYCLSVFRNSALRAESGVFPHLHWGDGREDSKLGVAHFDRRHRGGGGGGGGGQSKRRKAGAKAKRGGGGAGGDAAGKTKSKSVLDKVSPVLSAGRKAQQQSSDIDPTTGKEHPKGKHHKHKNKHHKKGVSKGPIYGRPNVLISHGYDGIKAFSLRNGRPVCHVSLQDLGLYADMNNDGIVDHVQVITDQSNSGSKTKDTYMWIRDLVRRVKEEENGPKAAEMNKKEEGLSLFGPRSADPKLCHVLALSGLPAREEIFSASLCDGGPAKRKKAPQQNAQATMASSEKLSSAPPLLVECLDGHPHKKDIIFAMNNGVVSRYDTNGRREWKTSHQLSDELPTWSSHPMAAQSIPFLGRINFPKSMSTPEVRPILLSGEDGMTILSAGRGKVLASTSFPQASVSRPILGDFSGDGITDVMVLSRDAVWGYQITVITSGGGSNFLRLLVGLVFMGICAAAVRNSVTDGGKSGVDKRSTDE